MYEDNYSNHYYSYNTSYDTEAGASASEIRREAVSEQAASSGKKKRGSGGFFKKVLVSICLGLFFGLFAGIGLFAVQQGTGLLLPEKFEKVSSGEEQVTDVLAEASGIEKAVLKESNNVTVVQSNVVDVAEAVMPAMVSIENKYMLTGNFWGRSYAEEKKTGGSGIIVGETEEELLIVSNNHVVADSESLTVTFIDDTEAEAHIKGLDSDMDLAVIAVNKKAISSETSEAIAVATLGNSDELKLGEPVIAIGNALGYGQSVTDGIVSALNREIAMEDGTSGRYIQTNAAINPGNSGGALLNINGEVVGINSSKIGGSAIEGMGYAIPITSANPIIADLMEGQTKDKVVEGEKGYIGINLQEVTQQIGQMFNLPQGIYVLSVEPGSAAEKAGILPGDIIVKFDGQKIRSYEELQDVLQYFAVGDTTDITVMRQEKGQFVEYKLGITLGRRPEASN